MHVHGAEFHRFFDRCPRPLQAYIRVTLQGAGAVIALGDSWAQRLAGIAPGSRIVVVPNAVKSRPIVAQPSSGEPVRLLFLGEIGDRKGAFTLIDAWGRLVDASAGHPGGRLVLAGDGDLTRAGVRIDELGLHDHVDLLGWVGRSEVERLLRQSHVLVLPSRNEGQPMAVLEAMAFGLCVVVSDAGGLPDLVDEECGVLIPPDDVAALEGALRSVIGDRERRVRLGESAWRRVRERFDVDVTWQSLDSLYQGLAR